MFRGINVGGSRPLKMDTLRRIHEDLGFRRVRTYVQSGNAVFEAGEDAGRHAGSLERRILRDCGFEVPVVVRNSAEMTAAMRANPLLGRPGRDPRFLHATFLAGAGKSPSLDGVALPLASGEEAVLLGDVVYLYCPHGYGITKINNTFFERKLAVKATTRNWRTVTALEAKARGESP